jgi:hypothetical protein
MIDTYTNLVVCPKGANLYS